MNQLEAGFARVNITPMLGIGLSGYYVSRSADGILDELEINALALRCKDKRVVLLSIDNCGLVSKPVIDRCRMHAAEITGLPFEAIFISCTHTHTSPYWDESDDALIAHYSETLFYKIADAARLALADIVPASLGWAVGNAPKIAFVRRYRMKDGSIQTNPGVNNPEILEPVGEVDERVNVLRFSRENANDIVLINFGNHSDVVGGCKISADWPGFLRRGVEKAIDGMSCIFFNGAQGDVNHVNVHPSGGDLNDMFIDFDDVSRGYGHARHIGNVLTGAVMQVIDKMASLEIDSISFAQKNIVVPSNMPNHDDLKQARAINELHTAGRDDVIPYKGMMLTTVVAEAERMIRLENGPKTFSILLSAISIGSIALFGIPGEPFTGIGRAIKATKEWTLVLPCCITNGYEGYFPMREAYDEGGYEARSSIFKAGVAELIIDEGKRLLADLAE